MQELEKILEEMEKAKREPWYRLSNYDVKHKLDGAINRIVEIIRKNMSGKNTNVPTNDGWIPVEERLPEDDADVLITYADIDDENYTDICITTYGYAYIGGNRLGYKEWRNPFLYFKSNYKVIAWRPLPEPYRTERSE